MPTIGQETTRADWTVSEFYATKVFDYKEQEQQKTETPTNFQMDYSFA